jgi:putative ABC transport system substrate-binding protein
MSPATSHSDGRHQIVRTRRRLLHNSLMVAAVAIFTAIGCTGQRSKIPRLGFVSPLPDDLEQLIQVLRGIRYVVGQNITIESRLPGEDPPLLAQAVDELVRLAVDIIVIVGTPAAQAATHATRTIPLVFHAVGDPVASGVVANLARPEGNVTGVTNFAPQVIAKGLEYLVQLASGVARIAFVGNLGGNSGSALQLAAAQAAAATMGVHIVAFELRDVGEIDQIFESFSGSGVKALMVGSDAKTKAGQVRLVELAARYKVPAIYNRREFADAGGLIGFGPSYPALWQRVADLVDKILHGKAPADLPVEQPKSFDLVVNLRTAEKSGIPVPQAIIAQATEVIR